MQASLRRLWIQVTADRRRFALLCAVAAVGLLLWARMIIVSNMPRTAVAEPSGAATPNVGASATDKPGAAAESARGSGEQTQRQTVEVTFQRQAERDPFVISRKYFPRATQTAPLKTTPGKLPTEPAEDSSLKEARLLARLTDLLGKVKLEAAMGGAMAVINGKTYRIGDRLPAVGDERIEFTLADVRQRSIVLEFQGRQFEMEMDKPGND